MDKIGIELRDLLGMLAQFCGELYGGGNYAAGPIFAGIYIHNSDHVDRVFCA